MYENTNMKINSYAGIFNAIKDRTGSDETAGVILHEICKDMRLAKISDRETWSAAGMEIAPVTDYQYQCQKTVVLPPRIP